MARLADLVVVGNVVHQTSAFDQGRNSTFTFSAVAVTQVLKGTLGSVPLVRVRTAGGEVPSDVPGGDPVSVTVHTAAPLAVGETVVLFLRFHLCSNTLARAEPVACELDSDCDFGACSGAPDAQCSTNPEILCTSTSECTGTCVQPAVGTIGFAEVLGGLGGKLTVSGDTIRETGQSLSELAQMVQDALAP